MLSDAILANFLLGLSIALTIIGVMLWKIVHFEIKGEDYHSMKVRERIIEGIGENFTILGLLSTILAVLCKYSGWFNLGRTVLLMLLLFLVVVVRICSIEEVYEQTKVKRRDSAKG